MHDLRPPAPSCLTAAGEPAVRAAATILLSRRAVPNRHACNCVPHAPPCRPCHSTLPAAFAQDILFDGWDFQGTLQHDVGTGFAGQFGVFMNGRSSDGNLDLHR